jgi:hypothetical protein
MLRVGEIEWNSPLAVKREKYIRRNCGQSNVVKTKSERSDLFFYSLLIFIISANIRRETTHIQTLKSVTDILLCS